MTALAPLATLATPCTLLETDGLTIATQKLLLDGESIPGGVVLHHHIVTAGGFFFIDVPAAHMLTLDLDDSTIISLSNTDHGERYGIVFKHYHQALAYLAKHYGLAQATDRAPAPADPSPRSSVIVVPAHLSTPTANASPFIHNGL